MIALQIEDIKIFMNKLLKDVTFDDFEVVSVELSQAVLVNIEGTLNYDFFSTSEQELLEEQTFIKWYDLKPTILTLLKGDKTPSYLKLVFVISQKGKCNLIDKSMSQINPEMINGFYLNITYQNKNLKVITGTNYKSFTLDKSIEHYFDETMLRFFSKHEIPVTQI